MMKNEPTELEQTEKQGVALYVGGSRDRKLRYIVMGIFAAFLAAAIIGSC
jgi:hypothetical protein